MRVSAKFAAACFAAILGSVSGAASAADLVVITNQGAAPTVRAISEAFARQSGHRVTVLQEEGEVLERRLQAGTADVITGNPQLIGEFRTANKVIPATVAPFMMAGLGVSVRAGAPVPDISTVDKYKAALLAAKTVGYSRGCSGTNVAQGITELGIADQLAARTTRTVNGPVTDYVARGEVEFGVQQTNIMVGVPGTTYVGALPGAMQKPCSFEAGVATTSKQQEAARALMAFMTSAAAVPALRATHTEPPTRQ